MDDTFADESGILALPSSEEIPVHSTPIKGTKIPLPSTRNVVKSVFIRNQKSGQTTSEKMNEKRATDSFKPSSLGGTKLKEGETGSHVSQPKQNNVANSFSTGDSSVTTPPKSATRKFLSSSPGNARPEKKATARRILNTGDLSDRCGAISESHGDKSSPSFPSRVSNKSESRVLNVNGADETLHLKMDKNPLKSQTDENSNAFSRTAELNRHYLEQHDEDSYNYRPSRNPSCTNRRLIMETQPLDESKSPEVKGGSFSRLKGSPVRSLKHSSLRQPSLEQGYCSDMEVSTVAKQRQEIQLLVTELKDRDQELTDMMTSHQQQLLAWEQDRQRLTAMEGRCSQLEEDFRLKSNQLQNAVLTLKATKNKQNTQNTDYESLKVTAEKLGKENMRLAEEMKELEEKNQLLMKSMQDLSKANGRLQAREEELTTLLRLKEKDISTATEHMQELSQRLTQLDLRCKECQDMEREAIRQAEQWRQKYDSVSSDWHRLVADVESKSTELMRVEEENRSLRQQFSVFQKDVNMRERSKDEVIESMKNKQARTDSQLKNLRELYERQLREVSILQMHLDTSKEIINRQQSSLDEQQYSKSNNCSMLSEPSPLKSTSASVQGTVTRTSQNKDTSPSASLAGKFHDLETDILSSHQHTQSSGYQTQMSENQSLDYPQQQISDQIGSHLSVPPQQQIFESSSGNTRRTSLENKQNSSIKNTQLSDKPLSPKVANMKIASSSTANSYSPPRRGGYIVPDHTQSGNISKAAVDTVSSEKTSEECKKEMDQKYMFENRLCSFLEDVDDIDDSIWDEKKNASSAGVESSPASKLQKLLFESRMMIQSLEKSTDSQKSINISKEDKIAKGQGTAKKIPLELETQNS